MDWKKIITDLMERGMSQRAIAHGCGLKPPSIIDLTSGRQKTVKWEVGTALLALHASKNSEAR